MSKSILLTGLLRILLVFLANSLPAKDYNPWNSAPVFSSTIEKMRSKKLS
jgi:hypothetical protein